MSEQDGVDLRAFLATRDTPCPGCGYNLRGIQGAACPECNQRLALMVGLEDPKLGQLFAGAMGLLAGAGGALVCLVIVVVLTIKERPPPRHVWLAVYFLPLMALLLEGGLAVALLSPRGRKRFRSL